MVPGEPAGLAREGAVAVREEELRLAHAARVEEELAGRGVRGRVLGADADVELAEGNPRRLAAPARVDDATVEREEPAERGDGLGREVLLETGCEGQITGLALLAAGAAL